MYILYYGILFSLKKMLPFVTTWMDLEGVMLSEICWTQKDNTDDFPDMRM